MKRHDIALFALFVTIAGTEAATDKVLTVCAVAERLSALSDQVVAVRGTIAEKAEPGEPGFYIDELVGDCRNPTTGKVEPVRLALFENAQDVPQGYRYEPDSISRTGKILDSYRRDGEPGMANVTIVGVLKVGGDYAEKWREASGTSQMFKHRPYVAALLFFSERDVKIIRRKEAGQRN